MWVLDSLYLKSKQIKHLPKLNDKEWSMTLEHKVDKFLLDQIFVSRLLK